MPDHILKIIHFMSEQNQRSSLKSTFRQTSPYIISIFLGFIINLMGNRKSSYVLLGLSKLTMMALKQYMYSALKNDMHTLLLKKHQKDREQFLFIVQKIYNSQLSYKRIKDRLDRTAYDVVDKLYTLPTFLALLSFFIANVSNNSTDNLFLNKRLVLFVISKSLFNALHKFPKITLLSIPLEIAYTGFMSSYLSRNDNNIDMNSNHILIKRLAVLEYCSLGLWHFFVSMFSRGSTQLSQDLALLKNIRKINDFLENQDEILKFQYNVRNATRLSFQNLNISHAISRSGMHSTDNLVHFIKKQLHKNTILHNARYDFKPGIYYLNSANKRAGSIFLRTLTGRFPYAGTSSHSLLPAQIVFSCKKENIIYISDKSKIISRKWLIESLFYPRKICMDLIPLTAYIRLLLVKFNFKNPDTLLLKPYTSNKLTPNQNQILLLIKAIIANPKVLLLDNLNTISSQQLAILQECLPKSLIITTQPHNQEVPPKGATMLYFHQNKISSSEYLKPPTPHLIEKNQNFNSLKKNL